MKRRESYFAKVIMWVPRESFERAGTPCNAAENSQDEEEKTKKGKPYRVICGPRGDRYMMAGDGKADTTALDRSL